MQIIQQDAFAEPAVALYKDEPLVIHRLAGGHNRAIVIFVHGLNGARYTTWGDFPRFLFEDFPQLEPLVVDLGFYEYRTAFGRLNFLRSRKLETEAAVMADILRDLRDYRKILLIVHSMGGILAKCAIANLVLRKDPGAVTTLAKIAGLIMMATPQSGSGLAFRPISWLTEDARVLAANNPVLTANAATFNEHIVSRVDDYRADRTLIPMWMVGAADDLWVSPFSSGFGLTKQQQKLVTGTHTEIVKPKHRDSDAYVWVRDRIQDGLNLDLEKLAGNDARRSHVGEGVVREAVFTVEQQKELINRLSAFVSGAKWMLDQLSGTRGTGGHGRSELIGLLTEARQITDTLPASLSIYKSELLKAIGEDLAEGVVYEKAKTVYEIMRQLLSALGR